MVSTPVERELGLGPRASWSEVVQRRPFLSLEKDFLPRSRSVQVMVVVVAGSPERAFLLRGGRGICSKV